MPPSPAPALRKPLDAYAITVMVGLCVCWGLQQVVIKVAAPDMNPVLQVGLRSLFAALLVTGLMVKRGESLTLRDGTFGAGALVGLLFGGEFLVVSLGLIYTTAGHMAVFLYTAPVFTALGLHWFVEGERLQRRQWWGVGLAFAGIATAFSGSLLTPGGTGLLLGDALGVLGGIFWAASTIIIRTSRLSEAAATRTLLYQLAGAAALLLLVAWWQGQWSTVIISPTLIASLAFQTVVIAFVSFLLWFGLLREYLASRLSIFSFLTPLFGVAFGVLFLHEPLDLRFVLGAVLVLAGITFVNVK